MNSVVDVLKIGGNVDTGTSVGITTAAVSLFLKFTSNGDPVADRKNESWVKHRATKTNTQNDTKTRTTTWRNRHLEKNYEKLPLFTIF